MNANFFRIMAIDAKRAFVSYTFLIAVLGVTLSCFATMPVIGIYQVDVVYVWLQIHRKSQTLLAFLFSMFPYGLCFYQDFAHKNVQNVVARISVPTYAVSKVFASIISCITAYVAGKLLFVLLLSTKMPLKYSLGMRQRLAIAQVIMEEPEILILDEPMNGLDKNGIKEMRELFLEKKRQNKLLLLASHSREDIEYLCDRAYELENGIMRERDCVET